MKKLVIALVSIISILILMFVEYKYIIFNLHPYLGENNTVYIELFDRVDTYYAEPFAE